MNAWIDLARPRGGGGGSHRSVGSMMLAALLSFFEQHYDDAINAWIDLARSRSREAAAGGGGWRYGGEPHKSSEQEA